MSINVIRIADAREVFETAINACFGRYFRREDYIYDGAIFVSYEIVNDMSRGTLKIRVTDADVQFRLDGNVIMTWTPSSISEIDEGKVAKHMQGYSLVDLYIDFFNEVKHIIEKRKK